jgi:hypothetical protein
VRHLSEGALALYDLSSSYFEGPLLSAGQDWLQSRRQAQYTAGQLRSIDEPCRLPGGDLGVCEGNTADVTTLMPQVNQLREHFGLKRLVLIGDRGMISHKAIDTLRSLEGLAWITALKSSQIRALAQGGTLQLGLFDERNLLEFSHPDFPNERLMACRNVDLGKLRAHKREALLAGELSRNSESARPHRERLTRRARQNRRTGRQGAQQVQSRQAFCTHSSRRAISSSSGSRKQIAAEAALDGTLRDPHQRPEEADELQPRRCAAIKPSPKSSGRSVR